MSNLIAICHYLSAEVVARLRAPPELGELPAVQVEVLDEPLEWLDRLHDPALAVAALGPDAPLDILRRLLNWVEAEALSRELPQILLVHEVSDSELRHRLQSNTAIYWSRPGLNEQQLQHMLIGAAQLQQRRQALSAANTGEGSETALINRLVGQVANAIKGDDRPERLEAQVAQTLHALLGPVQIDWYGVDHVGRQLMRGFAIAVDATPRPCSGLVGYTLRSNRCEVFFDCERDPRYEPDVDGVRQNLVRHTVVIPLHDVFGETRLLLTLSAPASQWPSCAGDARLAEQFVRAVTPLFLPHLYQDASFTQAFKRSTRSGAAQQQSLFRSEALVAREDQSQQSGTVLTAGPGWTRHTFRLLLVGALLLVLGASLVQVRQYATGPGVVRIGQRTAVQAPSAGSISEIVVQAGARVSAGEVLLKLDQRRESAALEQAQQVFASALRARLLAPDDNGIAAQVSSSRAALAQAEDALAQREVIAPVSGVVADMRLEEGQYVNAGRFLLAISADTGSRRVLALIPGSFRPQLAPGQRLRLKLNGYPMTQLNLDVVRIGEDLVGPALARSMLGANREDAFVISGSSVWVEAELAQSTFTFAGRELALHDGLFGEAEIAVDRAPLLLHLLPGANLWR